MCFSRLGLSEEKSGADCWARRSAFGSRAGSGPLADLVDPLRSFHADGLAFYSALLVGVNGWLGRAKSGRAPTAVSRNSEIKGESESSN